MKKIVIAFLFLTNISFSQSIDTTGIWLVNSGELMTTVKYLASPELAGRLGGSHGFYVAADFAAKEFLSLGLQPISNGGFFQNFYVEYNEIYAPCNFNLKKDNKVVKSYVLGTDFSCRGYTGSGHYTASVVFCGFGESNDDYNDFKDIDVKGKIVLMFKTQPSFKIDNISWLSSLRRKANNAYYNGALAVLFVSKPNDAKPQKPIGSTMDGDGIYYENLPMLQVDVSVGEDLVKGTGYTLKELQSKIESDKKPFSVTTNNFCEIEVNAKYTVKRNTMNIVGKLEGSDPELKKEYIIIGAHLDHVGSQADKIYYPGANDNASGSAAVLQIARAIVNSGITPKRSIIFILFSNEESGLEGAKYFTNNPLVPLENVTCMFNMDCVAYGDSIMIGNGKSSPELWSIANRIDSLHINQMVHNTWGGGGADAQPFHEKGIPCLYFVTTNSYDHLHLPSDKPETLNQPLYDKISRLAFLILRDVSNGNYSRENVQQ